MTANKWNRTMSSARMRSSHLSHGISPSAIIVLLTCLNKSVHSCLRERQRRETQEKYRLLSSSKALYFSTRFVRPGPGEAPLRFRLGSVPGQRSPASPQGVCVFQPPRWELLFQRGDFGTDFDPVLPRSQGEISEF